MSVKTFTFKAFLIVMLLSGIAANAQIINTFAGNGTAGYSGDGGLAINAVLSQPDGVVVDAAGNVYEADSKYCIRKINTAGIISTVAGTGIKGYSGDGGLATAAQIGAGYSVAVNAKGDLYIADGDNNRLRKVDAATGIITTIAGDGTYGQSAGDGGLATLAHVTPYSVTVDAAGNIYFADIYNIRKIDITTGIITSVAGYGVAGFGGDNGPATSAALNTPNGVAIDAAGNMYIADYFNNRIRKVDAAGIITTVAGTGAFGYTGDGGLATAASVEAPAAVAVDAAGNLYIGQGNNVRKVDAAGIITTVVGNGSAGYTGDGGPAILATLQTVFGIAFDARGNMYIADDYNYAIRVVTPPPCTSITAGTITSSGGNVFCQPDSTILSLSSSTTGYGGIAYQWQSSANGTTWANVGTAATYATGAMNSTTYYRAIATCTPASLSDTTLVDTLTINPSTPPAVTVTANPGTHISVGTSVTFTATVTNGGNASYQWEKNGGNIGTNSATYTDNTLKNNDVINCIVHNNTTCATPDSGISNSLTIEVATGINSVVSGTSIINMYPNPNNGSFNISGMVGNDPQATVEILNVIGQVVYHEDVPVHNAIINTYISLSKELANGTYILHINTGSGSQVTQFVIAK